jgi:glycosyltransferase involved in cell wall biosynthesis
VELRVHGPPLSEEERVHRGELEDVVGELGLDGRVALGDAVPRAAITRLFGGSDALVNNMREGAPDKVVYEAAASCLPVLASNPVFDTLLDPGQRFPRFDPRALADRIAALAALTADERTAIGRRLRERVEAGHSVQSWARGILGAAGLS